MTKRRLSKSAKIRRALLRGDMSPAAIAARYGSSTQTVYTIKSMMRKEGKDAPDKVCVAMMKRMMEEPVMTYKGDK